MFSSFTAFTYYRLTTNIMNMRIFRTIFWMGIAMGSTIFTRGFIGSSHRIINSMFLNDDGQTLTLHLHSGIKKIVKTDLIFTNSEILEALLQEHGKIAEDHYPIIIEGEVFLIDKEG